MLTAAASAVWSSLSHSARWAADHGIFKRQKLGPRVVSIGNIQAGGSGKTPLVIQIAKEAQERNLRVCILCRGYRSRWETTGGLIAPIKGSPDFPSVEDCGDEVALIHERAPWAWIGVGGDRIRAYVEVVTQAGSLDLVLLDDGFQNWKIHKDLEVVAVTSQNRAQTFFRDWPGALSKADLLVWTKGSVRPRGPGNVPMVKTRYQLPTPKSDQAIWLVTGVGNPKLAAQQIERSGYRIAKHFSFPDHARYSRSEIMELIQSAKNAGCVLALTGKDWVKWREQGLDAADFLILEPEVHIEEGKEIWDRILWG